jgi:hypothetical protein
VYEYLCLYYILKKEIKIKKLVLHQSRSVQHSYESVGAELVSIGPTAGHTGASPVSCWIVCLNPGPIKDQHSTKTRLGSSLAHPAVAPASHLLFLSHGTSESAPASERRRMDKGGATAEDVERGDYEHERTGAGTHLSFLHYFSASTFREI